MAFVPTARHLLRAKDLADARYFEPLGVLRTTDRSVADICLDVGLASVGSFTTSFTRTYGVSPTAYRQAFPSASERALIPACVLRVYARPQRSTFREDGDPAHD
jgi:AraC-like DNA-binding protein